MIHLYTCVQRVIRYDIMSWVRASPASLRRGPWARHIYPNLVLVQPRKTRLCLTERLWWAFRIKSNKQTNIQTNIMSTILIWRVSMSSSRCFCIRSGYVSVISGEVVIGHKVLERYHNHNIIPAAQYCLWQTHTPSFIYFYLQSNRKIQQTVINHA